MTHAEKLKRIEALMASPDVIELDALTAEVEAFERVTYEIKPPTIPEAMKYRREQMKENQREISMRAGMSLKRWKHLESGKNKPSIADARKLYAIGIPISVIFGENNPDHTVDANDMIAAVKGGNHMKASGREGQMSEQWHYEQKGESYIKVDTLHKIRTLETELTAVTEQRDRLAEALIKCREDSVCEQARMDTDTLRSIDTNEQIKTIIFDARMALHNAHLYLRTAEIISRKHGGNPTIGEPLSEATARCKGDDGIPAIISRIKSNLSSKQNNTQTP